MTDKERLEIIKDKQMQMHALSSFDVNWLIKQAERVQELANIIEQDHRQEVIEGIYIENKCYREALEYISKIEQPDGGYVSRVEVAVEAATKALKSDKTIKLSIS